LKFETFELFMKTYAKFDTLFMNIQCTTECSLEKVNSKITAVLYL